MEKGKDNPFEFLRQARPGSLYRLLEQLPEEDSAMVLAHLPPTLTAQVMAYFPDSKQGNLLAGMREARRAPASAAEQTVTRMRQMLANAKNAAPAQPETEKKTGSGQSGGQSAMKTTGSTITSAYGKSSPSPQPWKPRVTNETPINAPQRPNQPPAVKGDPAKSPIGKLNLLELLGLAKPPAGAAKDDQRQTLPASAKTTPLPPKPPSKGVLRNPGLTISKTPRVLGIGKQPPVAPRQLPAKPPAAAKRPEAGSEEGEGRKMDGMAMLAAIMRNASVDVRHNVAEENPALFKALKERMFVFDDLIVSDDEALAQIFTVAPLGDAALALRFAPPLLRDRAMRAVSPRRAAMLRDEGLSQNARSGLDDIEEAQKRVLEVALRLQSAGRILIDPDDPDLAL